MTFPFVKPDEPTIDEDNEVTENELEDEDDSSRYGCCDDCGDAIDYCYFCYLRTFVCSHCERYTQCKSCEEWYFVCSDCDTGETIERCEKCKA